jgi:hypothetical protein
LLLGIQVHSKEPSLCCKPVSSNSHPHVHQQDEDASVALMAVDGLSYWVERPATPRSITHCLPQYVLPSLLLIFEPCVALH